MSIDTKILRELDPPMFAALDPADLSALAERLASVTYRAQEMVFARGDRSDSLLLILSGRLRLSVSSPEGREISFRVAGPYAALTAG